MTVRKRHLGWLAPVLVVAGAWAVEHELETRSESWTRVERRDLVVGVDVEGELRAVETVQLGPPPSQLNWEFKISFLAPEGSDVEVGQPVVGFDTTQLERQLRERQATRDLAEKKLEKKLADLNIERRGHELKVAEARGRLRRADLALAVPADVAARRELEKARIDHRLAELEIDFLGRQRAHDEARNAAEVAGLRKARDLEATRERQLRDEIDQMRVRAPRAGKVIYVTTWRGEKKKVGDSVWRAEKVVEIPDLSRMRAEGEVAEADAGRIAVGQAVTLRLDAHPDQEYTGRVRSIRRTVQRKSWSNPLKIVKLEIALDRTDSERMRPAMRFRGTIERQRLRQVLVVPHEAVFPRPDGAVVYVRTLTAKREVRPQFGERNRELFEVPAGLEEGDWVLLRSRGEEEEGG